MRRQRENHRFFSSSKAQRLLSLFVNIWISLCSAKRLCVLCGSNVFVQYAQREVNEKIKRKPQIFFLYSAASFVLFVNYRIIARCNIEPYRLPFKAYRLAVAAML